MLVYLLQLVRCCPTIREFAPAGDLGLDIVVVVEGGGGEAGWGHRGGEADVAADQSELNILPSNHSSPAQLENGEVVVRVVVVWMVDPLPHPKPPLPIRPEIIRKLFYTGSLKIMVGQKLHLRAIKRLQIKF